MTRRQFARRTGVAVLLAGVTEGVYAARKEWELLGTAHVDGRADHDSIAVGLSDGRFRFIQLRVAKAPIEFDRVVVHYGDGEPEDIPVRNRIAAGSQTRAINLKGYSRLIRRVELWYAKGNAFSRQPEVQLYGMR